MFRKFNFSRKLQELEDLRREYADYKHEALKEHVQLTHELAELKVNFPHNLVF